MNKSNLIRRIKELVRPLEPVTIDHPIRLDTLRGIRCVAFDFYGTMFMSGVGDIGIDEKQEAESEQFFREALQSTVSAVSDPEAGSAGLAIFEETIQTHIDTARAKGIDHPEPDIIKVWQQVLNELAVQDCIEGTIDRTTAMRFGVEFEFRINTIWPYPGLTDTLRALLDRELTLGIISNSQYYTPLAFEAFLGRSPADYGFDPTLLVWSFEKGVKKPSPALYRSFIEALPPEILPEHVLYVGNDIQKDMQPAHDLGMKTALFVGDERSIRHESDEIETTDYPDLIIDDLSQITESLH